MSLSGGVTVTPSVTPSPAAPARQIADGCTAIIFGAAGDLARRKLLPALYQLARASHLDDNFRVLGVALEPGDDASFRQLARTAIQTAVDSAHFDDTVWRWMERRLFYISGDFTQPATFAAIGSRLAELEQVSQGGSHNRLFYLAVPPSVFEPAVRNLSASGVAPRSDAADVRPWVRVVVEKPFGRDESSARALNTLVLSLFAECQIYRIDHYLGKETVQNVLVLRFGNTIFEPLWNRQWISHVQITAAEDVGIGTRGKYYEEAGVVRDMFQNHLLQLLALTAMEPPRAMTADAVRDEKTKVLQSVRWLTPETIPLNAVRAQYAAGSISGESVSEYRAERNVAPDSTIPTFAAVRLYLDNWRWQGVPFLLRSGKRMARRASEIAVQFHRPPHLMFGHEVGESLEPNVLVIRVQPDEGIALRFQVKVPGTAVALTSELEVSPVSMDFCYADVFGGLSAPAYETLLLDVMIGEMTLFTRSDEVEAAWRVVDPLIRFWAEHPPAEMPSYDAGSWGPSAADALIAEDGFAWRNA